MAIFKCKMCGGTLEVNNNETVLVCEYCGTQQTLPKLDGDRRANLYDRANHFRRNNEYDKAMGVYEQILNEDNTDSEAYWSLVLCRYGIDYVEDPVSQKRVPTVNRAQFTSIYDDNNYKSAIQYADGYQRIIYEEEAKTINEIQKEILAISKVEEPFDIFICYKETDNNGQRTPDSVLANDLYHQLTQEGFKVFFARITLEDKLGTAYEPYIFAALNSSKVMVVLGTKPEFFNAVWVKNEWSRYLALIKGGARKILIPAYRDMDPYDLPEEFSHLQAQDMSKLGFMQDLIRGIKKVVKLDESKEIVVKEKIVENYINNTSSLMKRAFLFLEDGDWQNADGYCEKVLDIDPENTLAYLGKMMADLHVRRQEELNDCTKPFDNNSYYKKVMRFGDDKLKITLQGYIDHINNRNEKELFEATYNKACHIMKFAKSEDDFKKIANLFDTISNYKDSAALAATCRNNAETAKKKNTQNKSQSVAESSDRKPLTTVTPSSVLLGIVYAALLCGLTMLMDKIPVPSKDSTLWLMMAGFYLLLVVISIFLEKLIGKKIEIKRTLYYITAQLAILAVIILLIAAGVRDNGEEYYNSKELSYAMAFAFTEFVLLLYHLIRIIVLHILHSSEEQNSKQKKKKKKGKR